MKNFSELGVTMKRSLVGNSVLIDNILDQELVVEFFLIKDSKKTPGTDCLHLQIKINDEQRVIFSSSTFLMNQLKQLKDEHFPFKAKIIKVNRHYEFK